MSGQQSINFESFVPKEKFKKFNNSNKKNSIKYQRKKKMYFIHFHKILNLTLVSQS